MAGGGAINGLQVSGKGFAILPDDVLEAVADLMNDAALDFHLGKDRADGFLEAGETIHTSDEHVLHAPVFQVCDHAQPETGPLLAVADPMPQNVLVTLQIDRQDDVNGPIFDLVILAQLVVNGIQLEDGIDRC